LIPPWSRAHADAAPPAHVAAENIEKLRQFVDARAADELADTRDAVVVPLRRLVAVLIAQIGLHAAELKHRKQLVSAA
jgi:hypothetical protein